jgi:hypothetical protein
MQGNEKNIQIAAAAAKINALEKLGEKFIAELVEAKSPEAFPGGIGPVAGTLIALVLGTHLDATPRIVRTGDGEFSIEYAFFPRVRAPESPPVWKFYLHEGGKLFDGPVQTSSKPICDYNNREYVKGHLLRELGYAFLNSSQFAPL